MNSMLGDLTRGILAEYLGQPFTKAKMNEATARIVKSFLMTRQGANLPETGIATSFSNNEVVGMTKAIEDVKPVQESKPEPPPLEAAPAVKKNPLEGKILKAVISVPDACPDGGDTGPVSFWGNP